MAFEPEQVSVLWPDSERGPWCVTVWWRVQYGVPTPVGIALTSWQEPRLQRLVREQQVLPKPGAELAFPRVEGVLLRKLPMTDLLERTRAIAEDRLGVWATAAKAVHERADLDSRLADHGPESQAVVSALVPPGDEWSILARESSAAEQRVAFARRAGTRDLGDAHYREVARVYAAAVAGGKPTQAVADHFQIEKSSAAKKVARARQRGFLPKTTRGRAGSVTEEL